jgi:hypothetical protein
MLTPLINTGAAKIVQALARDSGLRNRDRPMSRYVKITIRCRNYRNFARSRKLQGVGKRREELPDLAAFLTVRLHAIAGAMSLTAHDAWFQPRQASAR